MEVTLVSNDDKEFIVDYEIVEKSETIKNVFLVWNGIWHYKKVKEKHDPVDVRRRDKLKVQAIKDCGYFPYIIKDMGKHNKTFVEQEFDIFKKLVESKEIYHIYNDLLNKALEEEIINTVKPITVIGVTENSKVSPPVSKPATITIILPEKPKKIAEHNRCLDCNIIISKSSQRCEPCYRKNSRKV